MLDFLPELPDFKTKYRIGASKIGKKFYQLTMTGRSLKASQEGITKAKAALQKRNLSQTDLATKVEISRSTVTNFFAGKPIDHKIFEDICKKLGLEREDVVAHNTDLAPLVQSVREKIKPYIKELCGKMRVLDMSKPIGLDEIYTDVNIFEKVTGCRYKDISELDRTFDPEEQNFDRYGLSKICEERVPGLTAVNNYSKLMVLGKPGAGKTTFLKYLAIQCIDGSLQSDKVPIFITLRNFAEAKNHLMAYIDQCFLNCKVSEHQIAEIISSGKCLILLDGLDEVKEEDNKRVLREIREFSEQYHENRFVITCRIAAKEYVFQNFTEVEVADFNDEQIKEFSQKWFNSNIDKYEKFIDKLAESQPIKELATNPLLLTLLCLVFEEQGKFKKNRSELYEKGLDLLLERWDNTRGIERDKVYQNLSTKRKQDLLSKIAITTFKEKNYFFKQREVEGYINEYIRNLPEAATDKAALELNSKAVLKSIEAQHGILIERSQGIYSFSHLTFHEYFTARKIVNCSNPDTLKYNLEGLVSHITENRWREVVLLAVEMSNNANILLQLMKQEVDQILANYENLQSFLRWVNEKSNLVKSEYKIPALRAFYLDRGIEIFLAHDFAEDVDLNQDLRLDLRLSLALSCAYTYADRDAAFQRALGLAQGLKYGLDLSIDRKLSDHCHLFLEHKEIDRASGYNYAYKNSQSRRVDRLSDFLQGASDLALEPNLKQSLENLKEELPNLNENSEEFDNWWKEHGKGFTNKLEKLLETRNIRYNCEFSTQEWDALKKYYNANKLLIECLNSENYVTKEVRQEIEDTVLLPIAEIAKRKQQSS